MFNDALGLFKKDTIGHAFVSAILCKINLGYKELLLMDIKTLTLQCFMIYKTFQGVYFG